MMIRTRFAPSPTGYLHIGGARTALFAWAYARRHGGKFVLRIEDTDLERSSDESIKAIIDGMTWLGLDWDEGPIRQMTRLDRYSEVADLLIKDNKAYYCYCSRDELTQMRDAQRSRGEKPRYDGRWRPENVKALGLVPPPNVKPVLRFRNPNDGDVIFEDLVKGKISVSNGELDDLVILRADGVPTYNFGVVVDDLDMNISHVIRGDDHVNNTPRQINIFRALGASLPNFAHVPMILGADGERLSKRHGAVSVMQYFEDGFLPEALLNYLARLGWSHGDAELFSLDQFVEWFDLGHVSRSPAQFNNEKLRWVNQQYIKNVDNHLLAEKIAGRVLRAGGNLKKGPALEQVVALLKERADTLEMLVDDARLFYVDLELAGDLQSTHVTAAVKPALRTFLNELSALQIWDMGAIKDSIRRTLAEHNLKMPTLAVPVRVCVFGRTQTPDLAAVLNLVGRDKVLERIRLCVD